MTFMLALGISVVLNVGLALASQPQQPVCPPESELMVKSYEGRTKMSCRLRGSTKLHGPLMIYQGKQLIQHEHYRHGVRHGLSRTWEANGQPLRYSDYTDGKNSGFEVMWSKGRLSSYGFASLPRERGPYRSWKWIDGRLDSVITWMGGTRHGREWTFHRNGPLASQADYFEGLLVGRLLSWDAWGKFKEGWCKGGDDKLTTVWSTTDYNEAVSRPCPSEQRLGTLLLPPGEHRIPAPSAATKDIVPPEVDLPGLVPPVPPPFPLTDFPPPVPEEEPDRENFE